MPDPIPSPPNPDAGVPSGEDKYDVPPANYRLIGQMLAAGAADHKAQTKDDKFNLFKFVTDGFDGILSLVSYIVGSLLSKLLCAVAYVMRLITSIDDKAAPGMAAIVKNSLGHVFGIENMGDARKVATTVNGGAMGTQIGKVILDALKTAAPASAGKTLQPGSVGAENFLAMLSRLGVEGWIDGFIAEAIAGHHGEAVLQLVPLMNDLLGLGRLNRRCLAPLAKILIADPFTADLHLTYRPTHLPESILIREYLRGKLPTGALPPTHHGSGGADTSTDGPQRAALDFALGKQGFSPTAIDALIDKHKPRLSPSEVGFLVGHNHITLERGLEMLADDGYDKATASYLLTIPGQRRLDELERERLSVFIAAYVRGDITKLALDAEAEQSRLPEAEWHLMVNIGVARRDLNVKRLSLGQVEAMIKAHVMGIDDLREWMTREQYPIEDQAFLEIWLLEQIGSADDAKAAKIRKGKEAEAAKVIRDAKVKAAEEAAAARLATKGLTTATFEQLVESGLRSFDDFRAFLLQEGLPAASITALVDLLHAKVTAKEEAAAAHDAILDGAKEKHLPLSQIEAAVLAGTIPIDHLQTFMEHQKFAAEDITTALEYVQGKLDAAAAKAQTAADADAAARIKGISLPNLERAARLGLTTPADYSAALTAAGFDPHSVELMTGLLETQIADDKATLERRAAAAAAAAHRNISLPALERAVINGLQPMAAYQAQLVNLGYQAGDVATLVALLQLQVDTARHVAEKKAEAAAKLAVKNLSLSEIERAVRLHVLSIEQYRVELADLGFGIEDIGILSASLLADLAAASAAATKQAAAAAALQNRGVSLAQEQQLVQAGLSSLDSYTAFLRTQGYTAAAAAQLTQLLADEIAQAATAAARHELAAARAGERSISLADEEAAVIKGVRTLDDYYALLVDLGFNPVDQATLIALLELRMEPAAAPAA